MNSRQIKEQNNSAVSLHRQIVSLITCYSDYNHICPAKGGSTFLLITKYEDCRNSQRRKPQSEKSPTTKPENLS